MNCTQSWLESVQNYTTQTCLNLPWFQRQHQVHPARSNAVHGQFVELGTRRHARVVHIKTATPQSFNDVSVKRLSEINTASDAAVTHNDRRSRTLSVTSNSSNLSVEEYWFMRWSRPLKSSDSCNCSFRRSWRKSARDSKISRQALPEHQEDNENVSVEEISGKVLLEDYVESLLQKTLTEVFVHLSTDKTILSRCCGNSESENELCSDLSKETELFDEEKTFSFSNPSFVGSCDVINAVPLDAKCGPTAQKPNDISSKTVASMFETGCASVNSVVKNWQINSETSEHTPSADECVFEAKEIVISNNQSFPYDSSSKSCGKNLQADQLESVKLHVERRSRRMCNHARITRLKPVLFFLHGVGSSADLWTGLVLHFTRVGYEVVAPDMLGHGYSTAPDNAPAYAFHRLLKDALDIFDAFVGNRKSVVIGHAFGCSLAAAVARYRSQNVVQLVLISGGGPTPLAPRTPSSRPATMPAFLQACLRPLIMCGFRRNILYAPCGKYIESSELTSGSMPQYVLNHISQGQDWPEGDSTFHRHILVPTLLVHGMQDPYVTLVQECEMERTIPRAFLELIPNAGHLPMLDTPSRLSHMIHCFMDWWSD